MVFINDLLDSDFDLSYKLVPESKKGKALHGKGTLFYKNKVVSNMCDVYVHRNGNGYVKFSDENEEVFCMKVLSMDNFREVDKRIKLRFSLLAFSYVLNILFAGLLVYSCVNLILSFGSDTMYKYLLCALLSVGIRFCATKIKGAVMDVGVKDSVYKLKEVGERFFFTKK